MYALCSMIVLLGASRPRRTSSCHHLQALCPLTKKALAFAREGRSALK